MQPSKFVAKVLPMEAFGESAGGGGFPAQTSQHPKRTFGEYDGTRY